MWENAVKDETRPTPAESDASSSSETAHTEESILTGSRPVPHSSCITINDDVTVLCKRLFELRPDYSPAIPSSVASRKRPSLAAYHRQRWSPQIGQFVRVVRDIVQSALFTSPRCGPWPGMIGCLPETILDGVAYSGDAADDRSRLFTHRDVSNESLGPFTGASRNSVAQELAGWETSAESTRRRAAISKDDRRGYCLSRRRVRRDGLSPTPSSSTPAAAAAAARANGLSTKRGLTLESVVRAASPSSGLSAGSPSSPTTPMSAIVPPLRRVSADATAGVGTPARSGTMSGSAPITATTLIQPSFVRTDSGGGRASVGGRCSRQNSGNKLDIGPAAVEEASQKELPVSRRTSGASAGGEGGVEKPEAPPRRPESGVEGKSTGAPGVAKAVGKKAKGKDTGVAPPVSVLIVEDNPIYRTILSTFIKRKKIKCKIAQNGLQAVDKWKTGRFHLNFMDIQMPVMHGIEATREIRRLEKVQHFNSTATPPIESPAVLSETKQLHHSPADSTKLFLSGPSSPFRSSVVIVALTASNLKSERVAALVAGCNDSLSKQVALDWLDKKIVEWG
ncbi:response regulator receiver [Ceratobasidium sp. AG-Ba]|nr:response regulator receiver [Ceratobasidium sp. AG-Ba]QRW01113.1 response regulator receiver [Ceratobasidium sp. AG-Ba]